MTVGAYVLRQAAFAVALTLRLFLAGSQHEPAGQP